MDFGSLYNALREMARAGLSAEEAMEALEAELAETSPRSSISRPRAQEYKPPGPQAQNAIRETVELLGSFLARQPSRTSVRASPKTRFDRPGQT